MEVPFHETYVPAEFTERINLLADLLRTGGFIVNGVEDVNSLVWTKLAVNVGINSIGALARLKNGENSSTARR